MNWRKYLKWAGILSIPILILLIFRYNAILDNDLWYVLTEGRYITEHGIYYIDPFSMHPNLDVIAQNWLASIIFWLAYSIFGPGGLILLVILANVVICILLYKLCMTISQQNQKISIFIMLLTDIILCFTFIVARGQIFTFINTLALFLLLESYIKTNKSKYLYGIPLISILEVNLHSAYWLMIPLFMVPYLIDSFKNKKLHLQGYRQKPLFITFITTILVGLINPYGIGAMLFIFTSFTDANMHDIIIELQPPQFFNFADPYTILNALTIIIPIVCYICFGKNRLHIRYILLCLGTLVLSLISLKGLSHFILVSFFPLASILPNNKTVTLLFKKPKWLKKSKVYRKVHLFHTSHSFPIVQNVLYGTIIALCFLIFIEDLNTTNFTHPSANAVNTIDLFAQHNPNTTVYTPFNAGGYVEFRGYRAYITPQAELFLKKNNHQADIFNEYYRLQYENSIDIIDFLTKYNFDYLLLTGDDQILSIDISEYYTPIYNAEGSPYLAYIRNDLSP
ncbi:hypothetical protein IJG04_02980 [Candidatus Saccharibacteria bacterium]|nr:hypothetical protein [Candidatus Saccharibacteria bacterium]